MQTETQIPAPQTEAWGFWGTMDENAEAAWPLAIVAIADTTGESFDAARAFLDSRHGRHFADDVRNRLSVGDALDEAVRFATHRWMSWTTGQTYRKTFGIPRGLPVLVGLTMYYGTTEDVLTD